MNRSDDWQCVMSAHTHTHTHTLLHCEILHTPPLIHVHIFHYRTKLVEPGLSHLLISHDDPTGPNTARHHRLDPTAGPDSSSTRWHDNWLLCDFEDVAWLKVQLSAVNHLLFLLCDSPTRPITAWETGEGNLWLFVQTVDTTAVWSTLTMWVMTSSTGDKNTVNIIILYILYYICYDNIITATRRQRKIHANV